MEYKRRSSIVELLFILLCICLYLFHNRIIEHFYPYFGDIRLPARVIFLLIILFWIFKNEFFQRYGLCRIQGRFKEYAYFLPLIVISTANLWSGFSLKYSGINCMLYIMTMLCTGFMEEILFRGFLFTALKKYNLALAFAASSLLFGIMHIVNLFGGAELSSVLLQIVYASALGYLYTAVFYVCQSILPCILSHSLFNILGIFTGEKGIDGMTTIVFIIILSIWYGSYLLIRNKLA